MQAAEATGIKPATNSSVPQVNRILLGLTLYIYDSRSAVETLKVNHQSAPQCGSKPHSQKENLKKN